MSLQRCIKPTGYIGTIIVENGIQNGVREIITTAPFALRAKYLYVPEANKSKALNAAIANITDDTSIGNINILFH
jgi:hypothetical protein